MEAHREIIDSRKLSRIINLPDKLKKSEVEIIVLPTGKAKKKRKNKLRQDWAGALSEYKNQYTSLELQKKALDWRGSGC
ncbi:MAG: hypothetical protein KAW12_10780 [Candidatus Aminicenantes bacterium]|nr:hypothetical protein [Candidatus Aminicenantes bacterium]